MLLLHDNGPFDVAVEVEVVVDEGVDMNVQAGLMDIGDWTSWSFWHMCVYMSLCVCEFVWTHKSERKLIRLPGFLLYFSRR